MKETAEEVNHILKDLTSKNNERVLEAIEKNRKHGNAETFASMLNTLKETDEPEIETAIIAFLYDLKDENSIPILIEAIENPEMSFYQSFLVAAFWQSAIDGSNYIKVFVDAAIKGDYMTTLEALTVVENFDATFSASDLLEYETDLNHAADEEVDENKKALLISMADAVRNLPIEGE